MNQLNLFSLLPDDYKIRTWEDEWQDMPEYINEKQGEPEQTAIFKFKNNDDFDFFMEVIKKELFDNQRVFDGKQEKNIKSAWYPLPDRPSNHIYVQTENE